MKKRRPLVFKPLHSADMPHIYFVALVVESMVFPSVQLLLSLTQKNIVNAIEFGGGGYMSRVYAYSALIFALVLLVNPLADYYMTKSVHTMMRDFRAKATKKLLLLPMAFFDRTHSGEVITRINSDLEAVGGTYSWWFLRFLLAVFYGGGSIILMLFLNWQLSAVIFALALAETWSMAKISLKVKENSKNIQEKSGLANSLFLDIVKGARLIRMLSIGNILMSRYKQTNEDIKGFTVSRNRRKLLMDAVSDLYSAVNLIGILSVGIIMYFYDYIDLGSVMAFLILQDGVTYMFYYLGEFFPAYRQSMASFERVYEILDEPEESIDFGASGNILPNRDITGSDISFCYPGYEVQVLSDVTFKVLNGKINVIAGSSGSGKSTLAKLLMGIYDTDEGFIAVGDIEYKNTELNQIRGHYSYVPQSPHLFYDTIEANIRCGNEQASLDEVVAAAQAAKAHDFIMEKPEGYGAIVREHGANLSGGQKQRIAIARAMLKNAPAVIWDEATNAVDAETEAFLHACIKQQAEDGKTVIIIAHRDTALAFADNVIRTD